MRISLALFLLPLTGAAAAGLTGPFTLHAGTAAPKALQRNAASWQGSGKHAMHVPLGWWDHYAPPPAHELLAPKSGAVFDSTGKRFLHLKAPNSHGLRELDVGAVRMARGWTVQTTMLNPGQRLNYLGYKGHAVDFWSACRSAKGWTIYFGDLKGRQPAKGCTHNFSLQIKYKH